jgi:exodeoxyribonuclease VII small subunit
MPKRAAAPSSEEQPSYETALAELERLLQAMEQSQLPLDQLLDSHRRATELLGLCRRRLDAVEQQVQVLEEGRLTARNSHS